MLKTEDTDYRESLICKKPCLSEVPSIELLLLEGLGRLDLDKISAVIAGGESGPGSRPIEADWIRSIRDQCASAEVPFFFKQWGGVRKKENGRTLDGKFHDGFPQVSRASVLPLPQRRLLAGRFSNDSLVTISL